MSLKFKCSDRIWCYTKKTESEKLKTDLIRVEKHVRGGRAKMKWTGQVHKLKSAGKSVR